MYLIQSSTTSAPRVLSGFALSHRHLSARQRAAIGAQLLAGEVTVKMTAAQLARLLGVSSQYISRAAKLPASQRRAIAEGRIPSFDSPNFTFDQDDDIRRIA